MKQRKGFVTNSSSSSFILTITFGLKDNEIVSFKGNGGTPECGRTDYFDYDAVISIGPRELALAKSIDELIELLTNNVYDENYWDDERVKIFEKSNNICGFDAYDFIDEIKNNIKTMDDILWVEICADEYNYRNYLQNYIYNKETGEYKGSVFGCDFEKDGGTGGCVKFDTRDCDIEYQIDEEWME